MFVLNVKLNKSTLFKIFCIIVAIIIFTMFCICGYKIYCKSKYFKISDDVQNDVINLDCNNYTNALQEVNKNIDAYVGLKVHFSGYVYRAYDFADTQFVLARDMIINSNNQAVIVGFLCDFADSKTIPDGTWVDITGKITKGNYHGDIALIQILDLNLIEEPNDIYVYPPSEDFIATSTII